LTGPLYEGLAAKLRELIKSGQLEPGGHLPSEADLVSQHRVSRHTVRQALAMLAREGLITSGQGRGWFVRDSQPLVWTASRPERNTRTDISPADAWSLEVRRQGRTPSERITVSIMVAEPPVADRLALGPSDLVVARQRVRYVDGEISTLADSFYPRDIVKDSAVAQPGDVLPGVYAVMEQLGFGWVRHRDELWSRPASREEADLFGLGPGVAVVQHIRTRFTEAGSPVAVTVTIAPGDRVVIVYEGAS
jgi:GntR family transcriptional regulator